MEVGSPPSNREFRSKTLEGLAPAAGVLPEVDGEGRPWGGLGAESLPDSGARKGGIVELALGDDRGGSVSRTAPRVVVRGLAPNSGRPVSDFGVAGSSTALNGLDGRSRRDPSLIRSTPDRGAENNRAARSFSMLYSRRSWARFLGSVSFLASKYF